MKEYKYKFDELVKVWKTTGFTIKAKNKKEADKIAKNIAKGIDYYPEDNYIEYCQQDDVVPNTTSYLFDEKGNTIAEI